MALLLPSYMQENSFTARDQRLVTETLVPLPGVERGFTISASSPASMIIHIAAGRAIIEKTDASNQGSYVIENDGDITATISTASAANPRIDRIVLTARDSEFSGSNNDVIVQVIAGTPAASPTAPAAPGNSITIGTVTVPKSATSIVAGNISNLTADQARASYSLAPQITKCTSSSRPTKNLVEGMLIQETDTGYIRVRTGNVWKLVSSGLSTSTITNIASLKPQVTRRTEGTLTSMVTYFDLVSGSALLRGGIVQVNLAVTCLVNINPGTTGNITNVPICTIKDPYRPALTTPISSLSTGPNFGGYASPDGSVYLANIMAPINRTNTINFSYVAVASSALWSVS